MPDGSGTFTPDATPLAHYSDLKSLSHAVEDRLAQLDDQGVLAGDLAQLFTAAEKATELGNGTGLYALKNQVAGAIYAAMDFLPAGTVDVTYLTNGDPQEHLQMYKDDISGKAPLHMQDKASPVHDDIVQLSYDGHSIRLPLPMMEAAITPDTAGAEQREAKVKAAPLSPEAQTALKSEIGTILRNNRLYDAVEQLIEHQFAQPEKALSDDHTLDVAKGVTIAGMSAGAHQARSTGIAV
jgi:hypothetical protein